MWQFKNFEPNNLQELTNEQSELVFDSYRSREKKDFYRKWLIKNSELNIKNAA